MISFEILIVLFRNLKNSKDSIQYYISGSISAHEQIQHCYNHSVPTDFSQVLYE